MFGSKLKYECNSAEEHPKGSSKLLAKSCSEVSVLKACVYAQKTGDQFCTPCIVQYESESESFITLTSPFYRDMQGNYTNLATPFFALDRTSYIQVNGSFTNHLVELLLCAESLLLLVPYLLYCTVACKISFRFLQAQEGMLRIFHFRPSRVLYVESN